MRNVGDSEHTTFVLGVVGVYRQCARCERYKKIGHFTHHANSLRYVCDLCIRDAMFSPRRNVGSRNRAIVVTELGHQTVREWERELAKRGVA